MIVDAISAVLLAVIEPLVERLPEFDVVGWLPDPTSLAPAIHQVDRWVPISGFFALLEAVMIAAAIVVPIGLAVWVYRLIPGKLT